MAAPRFVDGETTKLDAANATSRTISVPAHNSGDMIILAVVTDSATGTISSTGFSYVYQDKPIQTGVPVVTAIATVMWKAAGGAEGSTYTIDTSVSERVSAICFAVRGGNGAIHATGTEVNGDGTTVTIPAVTTSVVNCLRISIAGSDFEVTTTGAVTNHTLITQVTGTSAGGVSCHYKTIATASTDASETVSLTATEQWIGLSFAIAPATVSAGPLLGSFISTDTTSSGAGTTLSINKPTNHTGVVDGDFMLWQVSSASDVSFTPPAGWTLIDTSILTGEGASGNKTAVYSHVASGEGASYTFTFGAAFTSASMGIITWWSVTGATIAVDVNANSLNTPATISHVAPTVTTTKANSALHSFYSASGTVGGTPHSGMDERWDKAGAASTYLMTAIVAATGATGTRTMTGVSLTSAAITVAIAEASTLFAQAAAGTLTSSGALVRRVGKALAGTLTTAGAIVKAITKFFAGTLTSSGLPRQGRTTYRVVAGTLTSSGALVRRVGKVLAGTLTTAGALVSSYVARGIPGPPWTLPTRSRAFTVISRAALTIKARIRTLTLRDE